MLAALSVLLVVALSLLVTRVATIALTLTGMSRESARFQARSALTGAGFTTTESEAVVSHPVRRRIVMALMLIGSAGIVTVVGTFALSFATASGTADTVTRVAVLLVGVAVLLYASTSQPLDRALQPLIHRLLRRYADIDARDYARLLHVAGAYSVTEMHVQEEDWLEGATLEELRLNDEGVLVLGVQRADDAEYVGAPKGWTTVRAGDTLILYGHGDRLAEIDARRRRDGEQRHRLAVAEQQRVFDEERAREPRPAQDADAGPAPRPTDQVRDA